jgi:hypothetical protein
MPDIDHGARTQNNVVTQADALGVLMQARLGTQEPNDREPHDAPQVPAKRF